MYFELPFTVCAFHSATVEGKGVGCWCESWLCKVFLVNTHCSWCQIFLSNCMQNETPRNRRRENISINKQWNKIGCETGWRQRKEMLVCLHPLRVVRSNTKHSKSLLPWKCFFFGTIIWLELTTSQRGFQRQTSGPHTRIFFVVFHNLPCKRWCEFKFSILWCVENCSNNARKTLQLFSVCWGFDESFLWTKKCYLRVLNEDWAAKSDLRKCERPSMPSAN